jgi:cell division protein FtsL
MHKPVERLQVQDVVAEARVIRTGRIANYLAVLFAVIGLLLAVFRISAGNTTSPTDRKVIALTDNIQRMDGKISVLEAELATEQQEIKVLTHVSQNSRAAVAIETLRKQIDSLRADLTSLSTAISATPEKALSVPLLRKDMDDFKEQYLHDTASTDRNIERIYDQNKWFLALIVTMMLAILGQAVSNIFQSKKLLAPEPREE